MSAEIRVPTLGESLVDATIANWLKKEGESVRQGETLAELETDKINVEVNADQDGVLQKIVKQTGDTVSVGEVIGILGEQAAAAVKPSSNGTSTAEAPRPKSGTMTERTPSQPLTASVESQRPPSPLARRIAAEYNVDISQVKGSSPHGRVTREDVINYMEQNTGEMKAIKVPQEPQPQAAPAAPRLQAPAPQPVADASGREERVRMSRRRQTIAQRLVNVQQTAAMLTTFNEVDMSAIMEVRARRKDAFKERHNVSLGFMSFFTKAVVGALKAFPRLNAEIQGNEMVIKHYYDIGIAVGADEGLVVPVVRDADRKSFAEIEREIADLARRARANTLSLGDLQGGTFTITNGGIFGSMLSTPILNGPQVGILGMHKIEQRPIALNGEVVIRPMMYVALSYDHRIVDGSEAVRFLVKIKELIEDPEALLLEG
ncbi:2-oxoglutarate dehydrogenase complex dihydrolipoyllysine-residue succinyltransferase [Ktedonospora formicarum]|uniref:Dihydrolipoyllysine-residue succinyltransferase component of 2-oxoglutarate dehydrogenase complex n=1 Tax=Ktedonospora formicarum TaxID=2778364 RepID=A0A8J3I0B8_9CHLR|nr:2-oxoglutarate dehydrogenase complex dihydrolipoyllysine-residue succinyltransferase [Ktedonospora formicarum]GHO42534.1 dihydrolipoyllysine-residue succinyltransferase component of 2-oxoglutarate dehydrogenase complex [Ktedonospora formicarum]